MRETIRIFKRYKWFLLALLVRGFKAKYKNSFLGIFWSLLNPLLNVIVFAIIFTFIVKLPVANYPLYLLCAILPWTFFNAALTNSVVAIVEDAHFVKNTVFPVEMLPLAVIAVNFVNLIIECVVVLVVLALVGRASPVWIYVPLIAAIEFLLVSGLGVLCAGAFVLMRDVNFILNFFLRLFFYFVPVIYPMNLVPVKLRFLYAINPLAVLIDQFTRVLFYRAPPDPAILCMAGLESCCIAWLCFYFFRKMKSAIPERL